MIKYEESGFQKKLKNGGVFVMIKKKMGLIMVLLMALSFFLPRLDVSAATSDLQVLFNNNGNSSTTCNTISANFKLINSGSSSVNLADLKFRYYYTADSDKLQNFYCDHAGMMNGWSYTGVTDKVTGTFYKISPTASKVDTYFEVGFKSDAGTLSAGGYIEIQTRVARNDWTNYDLSNDYSFKTLSTYGENNKIFVYQQGMLIYGEGTYIKNPEIMPTAFSYDKYVGSDLSITLTPNEHLFGGIVGLTKGKDYELAGNTVTLKKEYINSLAVGVAKLTFDFGSSTFSPTLTLTVKDTTPKPNYDAIIGTTEGMPSDTVTVPVSFKNVAKAGNVGTCNFYIGYDNTLLEAVSVAPGAIVPNAENNFSSKIDSNNGLISLIFLDNTIGDELIKTDGDFVLITFKIKNTAPVTTTPLEFKPLEFGPYANTTNGSITIKSPESVQTISPTSVVFVKNTPSDVVVTMIPNGNTFKGITGLTPGIDYTVAGDKVTIAKSYLNKLSMDTRLTFDFGLIKNPTLLITIMYIHDYPLNVTIDNVTGTLGNTINVPIKLTGVKYSGNVGTFNFYIKYDKAYLSAESVTAGEIIVNPNNNFSAKIDAEKGIISFVFLDNTIGAELISSDGVLANIKFKTLMSGSTPLIFDGSFVFGDGNMNKIPYAKQTSGKVDINETQSAPKISPSLISLHSYGKYYATDTAVALTPNGNVFKGITGLTEGVDYTVSGNTVTILKSYLNSLPSSGTKALTFDFGVVENPVLKITADILPGLATVRIGTVEGALGDTVTVPITASSVRMVGGIGTFYFEVNYDQTLLEAVSVEPGDVIKNPDINFNGRIYPDTGRIMALFLDNTLGDEIITSDGIIINMKFKVLKTVDTAIPIAFNKGAAFGDWTMGKISAISLQNGSITIIPTFIPEPIINPSMAAIVLGAVDDLVITLDPNGNTFKGITGLSMGTDYTVSGNTVTILKRCLNRLKVGIQKLTFDFDIGDRNPVLEIAVKAGTPSITINHIEVYKNDLTDFYVGLYTNGNKFNGIIGLKEGTDYTISQSTVKILKDYLSKLPLGTKELTFDFGISVNPVLKITSNDGSCLPLIVKIGTVKGAQGDIVTVPITLSHVKEVGNVLCFNFYAGYDNTLLEAVSVVPGNIIVNPEINYFGNIFADDGRISFVFSDSTIGNELITTDGIVANITFKILGNAGATTPIVFKDGGAFGDANIMKINPISYVNGSVTIDNSTSVEVSIGEATGKEGEIVTVPVSFGNLAKSGNIMSCDFSVGYDTNLLEAVSVEPGSIVTNAEVNFNANINTTSGAISFLFLDNTEVSQSINKDGVFANINFKLKYPTAPQITTPVFIDKFGDFGNMSVDKIPVKGTSGSVTIIRTTILESKINPSMTSFVSGSTEDLKITFNRNGNTFVGITGLTRDVDYSVLGSTVTILNSYLNSLGAGTKELTFDFGTGDKNPVLEIEVKAGKPTLTPTSKKVDLHVPANVVINTTLNGNPLKGIVGLTEGTDYIVSKNAVIILNSYLSTLKLGYKELTFDFGMIDNPYVTLGVVDSTPIETGLDVSIGAAEGKTGETVTVPIYLKDVAKSGNVRTSIFFIEYDRNLLDVVSIDPGPIVPPTTTSVIGDVMDNGVISMHSFDGQLITEDGVYANITFKLKTPVSKKVTTPISFALAPSFIFYDQYMNEIEPVSRKSGNITIDNSAVSVEKAIYPTFANFDTYLSKDVVVTIMPNADTFKGVTGLVKGTDYTVSGNTVTILKSYLSTLNTGIKTFDFDLGVTDNPVLTINFHNTKPYDYQELLLTVGKVTGEVGDKVNVPVNLSNVYKVGKVSYAEFCLKYDTDLLEPISVNAGNIIYSSFANFSSRINPLNGTISFVYFDDALGKSLISSDGLFANIIFKLKSPIATPITTSLTFKNDSYFGDGDFKQIKPTIVSGSVTINAKIVSDPKVDVTNKVFDKYNPAPLKVTLIPNGNTFKGITGLIEGTDYEVLGNTVTLLKSYLSSLERGIKTLTLDFGVTKNPLLNVKIIDSSVEPVLYVRAENAEGRTGQTVTVPVTFSNVAKVGNIGTCNFYIGFDKAKLEAVSVAAGDIITNAAVNFSYRIDSNKGTISFVFLDNTIGDELIEKDGVFANIKFKITNYAHSTNSPITFKEGGAYGDCIMNKIENVITEDGEIRAF